MNKQARPSSRAISPRMFEFLRLLRKNNNRDWFTANKDRYMDDVQRRTIQLIVAFTPHLRRISSHMVADPRPVGGSLSRIYRDTRFSADKTPFKTHVGIEFRHGTSKNARTSSLSSVSPTARCRHLVFLGELARICRTGPPFVHFFCDAVDCRFSPE